MSKANDDNIATGILSLCPWEPVASSAPWNLAYLSTSLSLNVILTLMIVGFLLLARRRIRRVMKIDEHGWLFRRAHIVVVESSAIFAVSSLLVIGPWVTGSPIMFLFLPALAEIQVRTFPRPRPLDGLSNVDGSDRLSLRCSPSNKFSPGPGRKIQRTKSPRSKPGVDGSRRAAVVLSLPVADTP